LRKTLREMAGQETLPHADLQGALDRQCLQEEGAHALDETPDQPALHRIPVAIFRCLEQIEISIRYHRKPPATTSCCVSVTTFGRQTTVNSVRTNQSQKSSVVSPPAGVSRASRILGSRP